MALDGVGYAKPSAALFEVSGAALARESHLAEHLPFVSLCRIEHHGSARRRSDGNPAP